VSTSFSTFQNKWSCFKTRLRDAQLGTIFHIKLIFEIVAMHKCSLICAVGVHVIHNLLMNNNIFHHILSHYQSFGYVSSSTADWNVLFEVKISCSCTRVCPFCISYRKRLVMNWLIWKLILNTCLHQKTSIQEITAAKLWSSSFQKCVHSSLKLM